MKFKLLGLLVLTCILFVGLSGLVFAETDVNPFIGTWRNESTPEVTIVFTATTYTNYFAGRSAGTKRYTYDAEKVTFVEIVRTPYGNVENKWTENYSFTEDKLILGGRIFIKEP